jgi:hypothetical protein
MRKLAYLFGAIALVLSALIFFSPYGKQDGFNYKLIISSVEINAPVDSVFSYLGNSANAQDWSVFVDHIVTLNGDSIPDGKPGSRRRAFCNANEQGQRWDELTTVVEPNKRRQLISFDYVDFSMTANGLATEQLYEPLPNGGCKLSFTLFYLSHQPSFIEQLKTYYAAYTVKDIFDKNIANVKKYVEARQ